MKDKGFTLFIAIVIMGTLLLIASGLIGLALRQSSIASAGLDSQYAFYAADTGIECAIYWDVANPTGVSAFSPHTATPINCNNDPNNPGNTWFVGSNQTSFFEMTFLPEPFCARVTVTKQLNGDTRIESLGYNTCDANNPRRVERAIRAIYSGPPPPVNLALLKPVTQIVFGNPSYAKPASNLTDGDHYTDAYPGGSSLSYEVDLEGSFNVSRISAVLCRPDHVAGQNGCFGYPFGGGGNYISSWSIEVRDTSGNYITIASGGIPNTHVLERPGPGSAYEITRIRINAASTNHWIGIYELEAYP